MEGQRQDGRKQEHGVVSRQDGGSAQDRDTDNRFLSRSLVIEHEIDGGEQQQSDEPHLHASESPVHGWITQEHEQRAASLSGSRTSNPLEQGGCEQPADHKHEDAQESHRDRSHPQWEQAGKRTHDEHPAEVCITFDGRIFAGVPHQTGSRRQVVRVSQRNHRVIEERARDETGVAESRSGDEDQIQGKRADKLRDRTQRSAAHGRRDVIGHESGTPNHDVPTTLSSVRAR